jgi:hypothetical protein
MKRFIIPFVAAACILVSTRCSKGGGGGGGGCNESAMTVVSSPANGTVEPPAPGPDFPLQVNITANKPSAGVTIEVKAHPDGSSTNFFASGAVSSTSTNNNFTITGTPPTVTCVVDITVTSKSCATNKVSLSYKYSKK